MLTAAALTFAINIVTAALQWITTKFGRVTTQVIVFIGALLVALVVHFNYFGAPLYNYLLSAAAIFSAAVAFYEVALQYIPFFKGPAS